MTPASELQSTIEMAWESRASINAANSPKIFEAVEAVISELNAGRVRVAERQGVGQWTVNQWVKKAVLLSFRLNDNKMMRAGDLAFLRQGADQVRAPDRRPDARDRRARGAAGSGAARQLHREERDLDALVREHRRFCRRRHDGRHLGRGRLVRADRQETCTCRAASASAACSSLCRPIRPSSKTTASSARAPRWSKGVIVEENSVLGMGVYIGQSTPIYDRATGETSYGRVPSGSVVVSGNLPRAGGAYSLYLRGDRQARGRADALQDQHQRPASHLTL